MGIWVGLGGLVEGRGGRRLVVRVVVVVVVVVVVGVVVEVVVLH